MRTVRGGRRIGREPVLPRFRRDPEAARLRHDPEAARLRHDAESARLRRDPAPSRLRYKLTRFWLRPGVRRFVNVVLPGAALIAGGWTLAAELDLRTRAGAAIEWVREAVVERPQFTIARFDIPDVSTELAEQIREAALVSLPASSLEVNVAAVRERIETLAAVERARVRALPSGALEIRAVERIPVVLWRSAEGLLLLDGEGVRVAEVDSRRRRADLPLVVGAGADRALPEARVLLAAAAPVAERIRGLVRMGGRRWDLVLDRDQRIKLPVEKPGTALAYAMTMQAEGALFDRDVTVIDLRDMRRPTARLTEPAKAALAAQREREQGENA